MSLNLNLNVETGQAVQSINTFFNTFGQNAAKARQDLRNAFNEPIQTEVQLSIQDGKVAAQIKGVEDNVKKISRATDVMNGKFGKTPNEIRKSLSVLKDLQGNTRKFDQATGKLSKSWKIVSQRIREAKQEAKRMADVKLNTGASAMGEQFFQAGVKANVAFALISASVRAAQGAVGGMIERAKELSQLEQALKAILATQESVSATIKVAQATALKYGVSIQSVEKAWRRVGPAANAAGLTFKETNDVITASTARMAQMGLNSEQSGRYMEALAQVMGKNRLQAEELRQQFSELDGALQAQLKRAAKALYGIEDLDKAMQKGTITGKMFANMLVDISQDAMARLEQETGKLTEAFDKMNMQQIINTITNLFTVAAEKWGELFGPFARSLADVAALVAGYLASWQERFPAAAALIQDAFEVLGDGLKVVFSGLLYLIEAGSIALENFAKSVESNLFKALTKVIPGLEAVSDAMRMLGMQGLDDTVANSMKEAFKSLVDDVDKTNNGLSDTTSIMGDLNKLIETAGSGWKQQTESVNETKKTAEAYKGVMTALKNAQKALNAEQVQAKRGFEDQRDEINKNKKAAMAYYDAQISKAKQARDREKAHNDATIDALKAQKDAAEKVWDGRMAAAEASHSKVMANLDREISKMESSKDAAMDGFDKRIDAAQKAGEARVAALDKEKEAIERNKEAALASLDAQASAMESAHKAQMAALDSQKDALDDRAEALDAANERTKKNMQAAYQGAKAAAKDRHDSEMRQIDARIEKVKVTLESEKALIKDITDAINRRYDNEVSRLNQIQEKTAGIYNNEIARLNKLSPAEKELHNIRVQRLKQTVKNTELSREERLSAQAQLDDMNRQLKVGKLQQVIRQAEAQHEANMAKLENDRAKALEEADKASQARIGLLNDQLEVMNRQKDVIKSNHDAEMAQMEAAYQAKVSQQEAMYNASKARIESEAKILQANEEALTQAHENEMARLDAEKQAVEDKASAATAAIDANKEAIESAHQEEMDRLEAEKEAVGDKYDAAIDRLEGDKEKLEAAHGEEMDRLEAEKEAALGRYDDAIKKVESLEKAQKAAYDEDATRLSDLREKAKGRYEDQLDKLDELEKESKRYYEDEKTRLSNLKDQAEGLAQANNNAASAAEAHATGVNNMADAYENYADSIDALGDAMSNLQRASSSGSTTTGTVTQGATTQGATQGGTVAFSGRWSGGPVSAGTKYRVNELGQEAFKTLAGAVSLIDAPMNGLWTAPSDGTVIPAHATSDMAIPGTGISVSNSMLQAGDGSQSIVRAINGLHGIGGATTNNVTIQSSNPTQAAGDMMVNLNRIKRNRIR